MSRPTKAALTAAACLAAVSIIRTTMAEARNLDLQVEADAVNQTSTLSWLGKYGESYFMQVAPDLNGDWNYVEHIHRGGDTRIQHGFATTSDTLFFRLRYSGIPVSDPESADFDGDGLGSFSEIRLGLDPFDGGDADWSRAEASVRAAWEAATPAWFQRFVDDPAAAFYDPQDAVAAPADVQPLDDYDGDGVPNALECLDGTDPIDFFNGAPAKIRALGGDAQTAPPLAFLAEDLRVSVTDEAGAEWDGAPIRFSVSDGFDGLWSADSAGFVASMIVRNTPSGSKVEFETPATIGTSTVIASLPNGESLTFTLYTVDPAAKNRQGVTNFKKTLNGDGTATYTWNAGPADGDFFKLQTRRADGTWLVFYETTYGSADLPLAPGQTEFSLTVDAP